MKIEFTGRQVQVPPEIQRLAQRKLEKLAKVLPGITRAHVIVTRDKHRHVAEVSVHSPRLKLTVQEEGNDLGASLANVIDRLARQAQRQREKRRERKRRAPARGQALSTGGGGEPGAPAPRVIRGRRFPIKPMTLDEAAQVVGSGGEGFLVFRDAATERVSLLYRRKDGKLGLVEPEV